MPRGRPVLGRPRSYLFLPLICYLSWLVRRGSCSQRTVHSADRERPSKADSLEPLCSRVYEQIAFSRQNRPILSRKDFMTSDHNSFCEQKSKILFAKSDLLMRLHTMSRSVSWARCHGANPEGSYGLSAPRHLRARDRLHKGAAVVLAQRSPWASSRPRLPKEVWPIPAPRRQAPTRLVNLSCDVDNQST